MKTIFEYDNVKANNRLESFVLKKLDKLVHKYPSILRCDIFFRTEKKDEINKHVCGMRLSLPGPRIYASSVEKNFENAIVETIDDLKDQLRKRKTKLSR